MAGLKNGSKGSYATDPKYSDNVKSMFEGVVSDYKKEINQEISENNSAMISTILDKNNYSNFSRGILTEEANSAIMKFIEKAENLNQDLKSLNNLK